MGHRKSLLPTFDHHPLTPIPHFNTFPSSVYNVSFKDAIIFLTEKQEVSSEKISKRPDRIRFNGRILFLTEDVSLIRRQLLGREDLQYDPALPLMNNISTDEITPGWVCFYYDETLGEYVYVGMREQAVEKDEVKQGGFSVVVSGLSKGCGSSRETAPRPLRRFTGRTRRT
jgi:hypothetical protein